MKPYVFTPLLLVLLASVLLSGCIEKRFQCEGKEADPCSADPALTNVRIHNVSKLDFCNVILNNVAIGELERDQQSCYYSFDEIYRNSYVFLVAAGEEKVRQPIDNVGETPLATGNYTFEMDLSRSGNITLTAVPD